MNKLASLLRETHLARFLIPAGLMILIFGSVMIFWGKDTSSYKETDAVVTRADLYESADEADNHEATYTVFVKYSVDGKEYEEEYGIFTGYKEGDSVRILYNPEDPADIAQPGNNTLMAIALIAAGLAAVIGGIISLVKAVQKQKELKEQEKEWTYGR